MRSINTSIVALLPVGALLYVGVVTLGSGALKDLALALFVGMAAGVYSSVFIATPLLVQLKELEPGVRAGDARAMRHHEPPDGRPVRQRAGVHRGHADPRRAGRRPGATRTRAPDGGAGARRPVGGHAPAPDAQPLTAGERPAGRAGLDPSAVGEAAAADRKPRSQRGKK